MQIGNNWVRFANECEQKQKLDISKQLSPKQHQEVSKLIGNYFDSVFAHDPREANMGFHEIKTKFGNPHKGPTLPEKLRGDINEQINEMSNNGTIKESSSPYSSNIVLVNKKDGAKRFCVDYRILNNSTVKDTYPILNVDETCWIKLEGLSTSHS